MARKRDSDIELDFDGLADSLTDLVGTLTLFVFLLYYLSHETKPVPAPPNVIHRGWEDPGKTRSLSDLRGALTLLEGELTALDRAIQHEETQIGPLRDRLSALAAKARGRATAPSNPSGAAQNPKAQGNST